MILQNPEASSSKLLCPWEVVIQVVPRVLQVFWVPFPLAPSQYADRSNCAFFIGWNKNLQPQQPPPSVSPEVSGALGGSVLISELRRLPTEMIHLHRENGRVLTEQIEVGSEPVQVQRSPQSCCSNLAVRLL